MGKDGHDSLCFHHHGEQLAAATAARTAQDVDGEAPLEQLGLREAARTGSQRPLAVGADGRLEVVQWGAGLAHRRLEGPVLPLDLILVYWP